jgi:hypothetical protein
MEMQIIKPIEIKEVFHLTSFCRGPVDFFHNGPTLKERSGASLLTIQTND